MALLLSQDKVINRLTELISKHESLDNNNNNKEVKHYKQQEELGREDAHDYIRKNERIHYIDDYY
jgi:hypothetical protein